MSDSEHDTSKSVAGEPAAAGPPENASQAVSADLAFELLTHDRRRLALLHLFEYEEATLDDLAEHVAAWEANTTVGTVSTECHKRVYTGLYHFHVPKLADTGVVEYDAERDLVSLTDLAASLVPYLEIAAGDRR